jgi:hypothetical protein
MHGILRLRDKIQGNEPAGWRDRYAAQGTEEILEDTTAEGPAINVYRPGDTAGA